MRRWEPPQYNKLSMSQLWYCWEEICLSGGGTWLFLVHWCLSWQNTNIQTFSTQTGAPADCSTRPGWWRHSSRCSISSILSPVPTTRFPTTRVWTPTTSSTMETGRRTLDVSILQPKPQPPLVNWNHQHGHSVGCRVDFFQEKIRSQPTSSRWCSCTAVGWWEFSSFPFS